VTTTSSIEQAAEQIARAIRTLLVPLGSSDSTGAVARFVSGLGWTLPSGAPPPSILALGTTTKQLVDDLGKLDALLESSTGGDEASLATALAALVVDITQLAEELSALPSKLQTDLPASYVSATQIDQQFVSRLLDALIIPWLYANIPVGARLLRLVGLIEVSAEAADPTHFQPAFTLRKIHWERFSQLFQKPEQILADVYGWGSPALNLDPLFDVLQDLAGALQSEHAFDYPSQAMLASIAPGVNLKGKRIDRSFGVTLVDVTAGQLVALLTAVPQANPSDAQALAIALLAQGGIPGIAIPVSQHVSLTLGGTLDATAGIAAIFKPNQPPSLVANYDVSGSPLSSGELTLTLDYTRADDEDPLVLLSFDDSSKVDLREASVGVGAGAENGQFDVSISAGVKGGRVIISASESDSFLATLLPKDGVQLKFDLSIAWSKLHGVSFSGAAALETDIAINLSLGPLTIDTLHIIFSVDGNGLQLEASVAAEGSVGPISASIDRLGVTADLEFKNGNLGPVDLSLGFKPPSGLGLQIDAGPITGGGYIYFDPPNGRYAGVLSLSLYSIQVTAIGLLDTKLPNGESGYSFLVIISVEFTPIQLGFGFTLNGVGGLCGINRDFVTDALQAGLRAHSLDHILFPKDPIKNAPAIISDLRTIFPPADGRYVFGPMLELGWGGGLNLVTAELGVLLALPSPVVIAILGQLNVMLPTPDAAIVELHLDVLGIIDFGKKLFSLDATLHDSRVVVFTIYGDMAMRLSWGDNPSFALSIGGLNPHFQPPDNFPQLKRLTIALSASDALRLTVQSYFAITSNSFQFGAKAELYAGVSAFNVYGWLGFDALFIFKPFSFIIDFTAGLALRSGDSTLFGISVDGTLSGPTPWHVDGDASISILFFSISVHVSITWGDTNQVQAPPVDAWPQLQAAIQNVQNWSGSLPSGIPEPVTLSTPKADTTQIYVDPSGVLTMRERVLPLNQTLTKFGEAVPGPQTTFTLDGVQLGSQSAAFSLVTDKFAPAQFEEMSDQDKLSRPSFDDGIAGFSVGAGQLSFGQQFGLDLQYADIYIDDKHSPPPIKRIYTPLGAQQLAWATSNGAARSPLRAAAMGKYAPPAAAAQLVTLMPEQFVVANTTDLTQRSDITGPVSKGEAYRALANHLAANPTEKGQLQVMPLHELAA
jgi:hypothetical protein